MVKIILKLVAHYRPHAIYIVTLTVMSTNKRTTHGIRSIKMWIDIFVNMWEGWSQKSISYNRELNI